jgi:hypothetical protein
VLPRRINLHPHHTPPPPASTSSPRLAIRLERVLHNRTEKFIFEAWCCVSFGLWGWSWHQREELAFALTFVLGFLPAAVVIVLTANRTLLRLLHKEFMLWYRMAQMVGFCAVMPYLVDPAVSLHIIRMQIVGCLFCSWIYCALDCVQLSRRFEAVLGMGLLIYWSFMGYAMQVCVCVCSACAVRACSVCVCVYYGTVHSQHTQPPF